MIYIISEHEGEYEDKYQYIRSIWNIDNNINPELLYNNFMVEYGWAQFNLNIHPEHLCALNQENFNYHLSLGSYNRLEKKWDKFRNKYTIEDFIKEVLKGIELEFKSLNIYK